MKKKDICWFVISMFSTIVYGFFAYDIIKAVFIDKTYQVLAAFVFPVIAAFLISVISNAVCICIYRNDIIKLLKKVFDKKFICEYVINFIIGLIVSFFGILIIKMLITDKSYQLFVYAVYTLVIVIPAVIFSDIKCKQIYKIKQI